ncbi:MAG: hypothetical protein ABIC04_04415, partial [Nanoarchaeota archaeon]
MKKISIGILLSLILIFGCSQDMPPEPGAPGAIGQSGAVLPNWATEPTGYLDVVPENLVFLPDEESKDL